MQISISRGHGYDVHEHKIITKDNYELRIHRLIHPSDRATNGPLVRKKKPYLLLHGLLGTSASYVLNAEQDYWPPVAHFGARAAIEETLSWAAQRFEHSWQSTADWWRTTKKTPHKPSGHVNELDFDGDDLNFASEFRQAHRKFSLPKNATEYVSNSLAFTLSNFGYDVWMLNLRGNNYSLGYNGRLSPVKAEYWGFNIDTLIKQDLMASINYVKSQVQCNEPIGLVAYSYSAMPVLGLLSKFPLYLEQLQPVVLVAPTMLTSVGRGVMKHFIKTVTNVLVSKNGPFPVLGRAPGHKISNDLKRLICALPITSKLCRLLEMVMHGQTRQIKTVKGLLTSGHEQRLMQRDAACGQTSKAVLHQIVENLSKPSIDLNYWPSAAQNIKRVGSLVRRSIILVHSESDDISSMAEVTKIRDSALRTLALVDYVISEPNFGHIDFMFSTKNRYLVNAEIARVAILFDYLLYQPWANRPKAHGGPRAGPPNQS